MFDVASGDYACMSSFKEVEHRNRGRAARPA